MQNQNREEAKILTQMLSVNRANDYHLWREVGLCLRNLTADSDLLDLWKEFSHKFSHYKDSDCEKMWPQMRFEVEAEISLMSLHRWAQIDNLDSYITYIKTDIKKDLSRSQTSQDIARIVYSMYKYQYRCISVKKRQ